MPLPENPKTVIINNNYYPGGLTEEMVWNHYQKYKKIIISEINNRPIMLFVFTELNKSIVKRKIFNSPFTLKEKNYDKILTGRTVSIAVERKKSIDYLCIDIDPGPSVVETQLKQCIQDLLESSIAKLPMIFGHRVISTAKGYHLYFYLSKKLSIGAARKLLITMLNIEFAGIYMIAGKKPSGNKINLDISPTTFRGLHQVPYALCRNGLMSMDITKSWKTFNRRKAII